MLATVFGFVVASGASRGRSRRRVKWLLIFGGVICVSIYGFWYFWLEHPVRSGPAGPDVDAAVFELPWINQDVLLVGLGDSITDGLGAIPASNSYFNRLVQTTEGDELPGTCLSSVLPNLRYNNLARSGTTSLENLEYLVPDLAFQSEQTFGIIVMTTGGNDIIHSYGREAPKEGAMYGATHGEAQPWIANYRKRLETTLHEVGSRFVGGCEIFLGNIYDPTDGVGNAFTVGLPCWPDGLRIHDQYNSIIAEVCARRDNVHLVDIRSAFLGHGIYSRQFWNQHYCSKDPTYWYWDNFEDPNNRGYDAIRRLFLNEITSVVPQRLNKLAN